MIRGNAEKVHILVLSLRNYSVYAKHVAPKTPYMSLRGLPCVAKRALALNGFKYWQLPALRASESIKSQPERAGRKDDELFIFHPFSSDVPH